MPHSTIQSVEEGGSLTITTLCKLAEAYGVDDINFFFRRPGEAPRS